MQLELVILADIQEKCLVAGARVEQYDNLDVIPLATQAHDHEPGHLRRARVVKLDLLDDFLAGPQTKQLRAVTDPKHLAHMFARPANVAAFDAELRVGEQRLHLRRIAAVLALRRHAASPAVLFVTEVENVEPVARIEAVTVHRLRAQDVLPRMEERHTLAQRDNAVAEVLHAHSIVRAGANRQLVLVDVRQRLVVVCRRVIDDLLRIAGVACARITEIVDVFCLYEPAETIHELVIADAAGKTDTNPVSKAQEFVAFIRTARVQGVRIEKQTVDETLTPDVVFAIVERSAAAHGVAHAVVERADAGAHAHVDLSRLLETRVVDNLAKVPAFAIEINLAAVYAVSPPGERP